MPTAPCASSATFQWGSPPQVPTRFFEALSVPDEDHSGRVREEILERSSPELEPPIEAALQQAPDGWQGFLHGVADSRSSSAGNQTFADRWTMRVLPLISSRLALPLALF